jgi:hypothetical protein
VDHSLGETGRLVDKVTDSVEELSWRLAAHHGDHASADFATVTRQ